MQQILTEIVIAGVAGVFGLILWLLKMVIDVRRDSRSINDAVNHRHQRVDENGIMPPKLFDIALDNHDRLKDVEVTVNDIGAWKNGYANSKLPNTEAVNKLVERVEVLTEKCGKPCPRCSPD